MGGVILGLLRLVISHHWIGIQTAVFLEENTPTKLLRCTFVTYLLHTLFLVLYMQTKQFFKNFFFLFLILILWSTMYIFMAFGLIPWTCKSCQRF